MLLKRVRTKRCQKSTTTSRSRCRHGKEFDKSVPLSNYGKNVGRLDWASGGNGYEEVNGGISMATRELRIKKMDGREQRPCCFLKKFLSSSFFPGLSASLRSISFSWRRKERMCKDPKEIPRKYFVWGLVWGYIPRWSAGYVSVKTSLRIDSRIFITVLQSRHFEQSIDPDSFN